MSRSTVTQLTCSRCPRVEVVPSDAPPRTLKVFLGADEQPLIHFEDLCQNCWKLVQAQLEVIGKKLTKESPAREVKAKKSKEEAPPTPPSPPSPPKAPGPPSPPARPRG